jgi:tetratricopeptide (TPR) repeat protein
LLYSAALDKNRIDICSDSIIHPAIAYYIRKGSDRERSMTYYYTGRICENAHDSEKAMQALQRCTDTGAAYHYRLAQANEMSGKYKEAVESYKIYIGQSGLIGDGIIDQDTRFVEERVRHTDIYEKVRMRNTILWLSIAAASMP